LVAPKSQDAHKFIAAYGGGGGVFLIHGADDGLVDERVHEIIRRSVDNPDDPFQSVRLSGDEISVDPGLLLDEWNVIGMFHARRVIRIDAGGKDFGQPIRLCLEAPNPATTIVIRAGALRKDSQVKQICERHKLAVAIECEADTETDIGKFAVDQLTAAGLDIDPLALEHLTSALGIDRRVSRGEVEKLILYMGDQRKVELKDVEAIVADAAPRMGEPAIAAAMMGNLQTATTEGVRAMTSVDPSAMLGTCLRGLLQAHRALVDIESGNGRSYAVERAVRSSGSLRAFMPEILNKASSMATLQSISVVQEAISRARREPAVDEATSMRSLWGVAFRMKRR
jgi:DNA polymerase-3 subunit delta